MIALGRSYQKILIKLFDNFLPIQHVVIAICISLEQYYFLLQVMHYERKQLIRGELLLESMVEIFESTTKIILKVAQSYKISMSKYEGILDQIIFRLLSYVTIFLNNLEICVIRNGINPKSEAVLLWFKRCYDCLKMIDPQHSRISLYDSILCWTSSENERIFSSVGGSNNEFMIFCQLESMQFLLRLCDQIKSSYEDKIQQRPKTRRATAQTSELVNAAMAFPALDQLTITRRPSRDIESLSSSTSTKNLSSVAVIEGENFLSPAQPISSDSPVVITSASTISPEIHTDISIQGTRASHSYDEIERGSNLQEDENASS